MPELPLTGACQCGALHYEVTKPPLTVMNCHCKNCQRISGAAFGTSAMITSDSLSFTKGEPAQIEWRIPAGRDRVGLYCRDCGSRIANGSVPDKGVYSLRAGTLDDVSWIEPVADIWMEAAQPWVRPSADRLQFPGQPESYADLFAAFKAQGRF